MDKFVLKNTFIKIYIYHFLINIFIKNKESKLNFGNHVIVLDDFLYGYGGSMYVECFTLFWWTKF